MSYYNEKKLNKRNGLTSLQEHYTKGHSFYWPTIDLTSNNTTQKDTHSIGIQWALQWPPSTKFLSLKKYKQSSPRTNTSATTKTNYLSRGSKQPSHPTVTRNPCLALKKQLKPIIKLASNPNHHIYSPPQLFCQHRTS